MLTLALPLLLTLAVTDDAKETLRKATEQLEAAPGYAFEMQSEYHGGLGGTANRLGRPRDAAVGHVEKGQPLHLSYDGIEALRGADGKLVARRGEEKWVVVGERTIPRSRAAISMLSHLAPPHELLRLALDHAVEVTSTRNEATGTATIRVELEPATARLLAGDLGRRRRTTSVAMSMPERQFESNLVVVVDPDGVREIDAALKVTVVAGARRTVLQRGVTYRLRPRPEAAPEVPPEVLKLLGIEAPEETNQDDGSEESGR